MRRGSDEAGTAEAAVLDEALDRLLDPLDELTRFGAHPRNASSDRVPVLAGVRAPRGTDVFTSVTLRARDVRGGVRPIVRFSVTEACPECGGTGSAELAGAECGHCGGNGVVEAERLLGLRIPAGVGDGAELRVRGEGNVPPDGAPGDLFVHVHVAPRASRPKRFFYTVVAAAVVVLAVLAYLRLF